MTAPPRLAQPVHPRACGEHEARNPMKPRSAGSSPRLRGTHGKPFTQRYRCRFIPAPAGNTPYAARGPAACAVHPRACGEHPLGKGRRQRVGGSSPRLRGTHGLSAPGGHCDRFIPAPAGNTPSTRKRTNQAAVHPRACGEHRRWSSSWHWTDGSSPRLRGTHGRIRMGGIGGRFIPAPAGNTRACADSPRCPPVHPRACGEHPPLRVRGQNIFGSSPRLRGTPCRNGLICGNVRFIPAPAGNTPESRPCRHRKTVHPRACGEHATRAGCRFTSRGSSPRLRGTLFLDPLVSTPIFACHQIYRLEHLFQRPLNDHADEGPASDQSRSAMPPPAQTQPAAYHPDRPAPAGSYRTYRTEIRFRSALTKRSRHCRPQHTHKPDPKSSLEPAGCSHQYRPPPGLPAARPPAAPEAEVERFQPR